MLEPNNRITDYLAPPYPHRVCGMRRGFGADGETCFEKTAFHTTGFALLVVLRKK